jgi:hypothetical protein
VSVLILHAPTTTIARKHNLDLKPTNVSILILHVPTTTIARKHNLDLKPDNTTIVRERGRV